MDKSSQAFIFLFLTGISAMLLFVAWDSYRHAQSVSGWEEKPAVITSSKLESGNGVHLDIMVRIDGEAEPVPAHVRRGTFISQGDYRQWAQEYPPDTRLTVYQNPDNPRDVVLERAERFSAFAMLWAGLGIGILVWQVVLWRRWNRSPG